MVFAKLRQFYVLFSFRELVCESPLLKRFKAPNIQFKRFNGHFSATLATAAATTTTTTTIP